LLTAVIPASAVDLDELTVVTLARDGSWGVARAGSQGPAIAAAIRACRAMAGTASDCGAQFTTVRSGWVIASLCGVRKVIAAAETREAAEQAMLLREYNLKPLHGPDMPPCRRVVTVNPTGATVTPERQDLGRRLPLVCATFRHSLVRPLPSQRRREIVARRWRPAMDG
jgi:hypothetical protein